MIASDYYELMGHPLGFPPSVFFDISYGTFEDCSPFCVQD